MRPEHLPDTGTKYWVALVMASIFGANTGDLLAGPLGHIIGLPILAILLVAVLVIERFDHLKHHTYFWLAIVIIRTAATNLGDIGHDLHIAQPLILLILALPLALTLLLWRRATRDLASPRRLSAERPYWWTMLLAGALGTALGDYASFGLHLGNLGAALALGAVLTILFSFGRGGRLSGLLYYWITVVCIRSAGTAAGDFLAHKVFGLPLSTVATGLALLVLLLAWRGDGTECPESRPMAL